MERFYDEFVEAGAGGLKKLDTEFLPLSLNEPLPKLSQERVDQLLFESFRHSQGSVTAQEQMFKYVSLRFGYTQQVLQQFRAAPLNIEARVGRYIDGSAHANAVVNTGVEENVSNMFSSMINSFFWKVPESRLRLLGFVIKDTLVQVLDRETIYLLDKGTRPKPKHSPGHTAKDMHHSYLVHHALLGQPTKIGEYTQMYSDIASWIEFVAHQPGLEGSLEEVVINRVREITQIYFKHHPERLLELPDRFKFLLEGLSNE